jgi:hypothetical protein
MRWIGLGEDRLGQVFPNLINFREKTLPVLG